MMFVVLRCRLLPLFAVLAALLVLSGLSGCAGNQAKLEGSWTTTPFEGELWVFEFNADRTAKFSGNRQRPTDCVWTRIDDIDQLKADLRVWPALRLATCLTRNCVSHLHSPANRQSGGTQTCTWSFSDGSK